MEAGRRVMIDDFIKRNDGKYVEVYDASNKNQCVDLVLAWIKEQGHGELIPLGISNASDIWNKTPKKLLKFYDKIPNTIDAIPIGGDIIVWSSSYNNGAGHTGVATNRAGQTQLDIFVQNDPLKTPCHVKRYNYKYILGWLRIKKDYEIMEVTKEIYEKLVTKASNWDTVAGYFKINPDEPKKGDEVTKIVQDKNHKINDLQDAVSVANKTIKDLQGEVKAKNAQIASLEQRILTIKTKHQSELANIKSDCQLEIEKIKQSMQIEIVKEKENCIAEKKQLENEISKLKEGLPKPVYREGWHAKLVEILDILFGYDG